MNNMLSEFLSILKSSLSSNTFIKLSLGNYHGTTNELKKVLAKRIVIKREDKLSFTFRYKTRDEVKNYSVGESFLLLENMILEDGFRVAYLFTLEFDLNLDLTQYSLKKLNPTHKDVPSLIHDKQKNRLIETKEKHYLHELNITDSTGNVYKNAQDKYKQINRYVELLSPLLKEVPQKSNLKIVDMGAGKGYLTFALYDYLTSGLNLNTQIVGVEARKDLVDACNKIAASSHFTNLSFEQGQIESYHADQINVLIALHACDTATDEAIYKGIKSDSDLIVVAPCCHKQIRKEIEKNKQQTELTFLLKYGIFLERQSEMVTDGIRALILEYYGYSTKVFEFISDTHTPKNVMITGIKKTITEERKKVILSEINSAKSWFGIKEHHLEKLLGMNGN